MHITPSSCQMMWKLCVSPTGIHSLGLEQCLGCLPCLGVLWDGSMGRGQPEPWGHSNLVKGGTDILVQETQQEEYYYFIL